jgi:hypothetical protein
VSRLDSNAISTPLLGDDALQPVVADRLEQRLSVIERLGNEAERRRQFDPLEDGAPVGSRRCGSGRGRRRATSKTNVTGIDSSPCGTRWQMSGHAEAGVVEGDDLAVEEELVRQLGGVRAWSDEAF